MLSSRLHCEAPTLTLLRPFKTFFRISDMLKTKSEMFKNQPKAIFELFARLVFTSRDRDHTQQYFQLRDLFANNPPYLSGTLATQGIGIAIDAAACELILPKYRNAKCYCRCRMVPDETAVGNWTLEALEIRATDWKKICEAAEAVGNESVLGYSG
ncbi:hypothetical protein NLU13_7801 [Sarocladium strictum]|uniref:Uncharacterized protein n=1 Tax=Sarocladium strictum TaxID=5046 RepID=A0AA39L631_SARSR|nr:hypothetical protein NLU13_7801 [Sarocladium strictum]